MHRRSFTAILLSCIIILVTAVGTAQAADVPRPPPAGIPGIEALAAYAPANTCDPTPKPGATRLADLLTATYPGTTAATGYRCGSDGPVSEHYEGRAVDWMTTMRTAEGLDRGNTLAAWLLATDAQGNAFANARRIGVMYIIWNGQIWGAYRASEGWRPYGDCASQPETARDTSCHRDHVHISLSPDGASGSMSYWTGRVNNDPKGNLETISSAFRSLTVTGWALDPETSGPVYVWVDVDGVGAPGLANQSRPDVGAVFPQAGNRHGFTVTRAVAPGAHQVCVYAVNVGAGSDTKLNCSWVAVSADPIGNVEGVTGEVGQFTARGWALDPETSNPGYVWVDVSGSGAPGMANVPRGDVAAVYPGVGDRHGFTYTVAKPPGAYSVCVWAVNQGWGADRLIGCQTATVR